MSAKPNKTAEFLKAMQQTDAAEQSDAAESPPALPAPPAPEPAETSASLHALPAPRAIKSNKVKATSRASLKHFGGYLNDESLEKIALLRVRLKKDNSELIELAIDDLYRKHAAKRAFGDA